METQILFPRISRRRLLKAGGLVAGAAVASALFAKQGVSDLFALGRSLKVGLLAPPSTIFPQLGESLAAGLQLFFELNGGRPLDLVTREIGFGPALASRQAEELVTGEQVEVVLGVMSSNVAAQIGDIFVSGRTPLVVSTVGAHAPRPEDWNPFTLHNSLNYWQANLAMGEWAARNLGQSAFIGGSFYESGYDSFNAFRVGFKRAGGRVVGKQVTHIRPEDDGLAQLFKEIARARPDMIFATYSGRQAVDFVRAFADSGLAGRIPLAASAFAVDDSLLAELGDAAEGIWSCFSWSSGLASEENRAFVNAYRAWTGRPVDPFALLGYDAARLILQLADAAGGDLSRADKLQVAYGQLDGASPRGALKIDEQTASAASPLYLRQVRRHKGRLAHVVVESLEASQIADDRMRVKSGWLNPYLCA